MKKYKLGHGTVIVGPALTHLKALHAPFIEGLAGFVEILLLGRRDFRKLGV